MNGDCRKVAEYTKHYITVGAGLIITSFNLVSKTLKSMQIEFMDFPLTSVSHRDKGGVGKRHTNIYVNTTLIENVEMFKLHLPGTKIQHQRQKPSQGDSN